ncbi:MAG: ABC transporter permease [Candidatus Acidiferrales bacterium]
MLRRIYHMVVKEFIQVLRDRRTRIMLILPPVIQTLIFGYAATYEIRNVSMAVLDLDHSPESRDLVSRFTSSPYFEVRGHLANERQMQEWIDRGEVVLAVHLPAGFAQKFGRGQTAPIQIIVDGTNSNTALIAVGYISQIAERFASERPPTQLRAASLASAGEIPAVVVERRPWYNESLSSRWFFVPGIIGTLMFVMVVILTAYAVVREREIGTLEQIMVTPISRAEFILAKTLPFLLIGLFDAALIATVGTFWFEIPFRGSVLMLFAGVVFYIVCMLGIGLFISTVSSTQQQAMVTSFFFTMPAITFSGFGYPIASMPQWMQMLTYLDPLRYFLIVIRSVYLKGAGLDILWPQMAALAAIGAVMLTVSIFRFHKSLD